MRKSYVYPFIAGLALTTGCFGQYLTAAEMRSAVKESVESGQVESVENGVIEITTDFQIGDAVDAIAEHIRQVLAACADTTVEVSDDVTILLDFGTAASPCAFEGRLYSGQVELVIDHGDGKITVDHTYLDLSNGTYTLYGDKKVEWSGGGDGSVIREVTSGVDWDGPNGHVDHESQRTMTFVDFLGGPTQEIRIDGSRDWTRDDEDWNLDIDEVELRLIDPVPQSGSYTLTIPSGKEAGLAFERIDEDTIEVTVSGGRKDHVFHVTSLGGVSEQD
jgi:hypothetical protein